MSPEFERELERISKDEQSRNSHLDDPYGRQVWIRFIREVVAPKAFDAGFRHVAQKYTKEEWLMHLQD